MNQTPKEIEDPDSKTRSIDNISISKDKFHARKANSTGKIDAACIGRDGAFLVRLFRIPAFRRLGDTGGHSTQAGIVKHRLTA
jgi:hypothetical protein